MRGFDDVRAVLADRVFYAIADCNDRLMLTPVAIAEGIAFAKTVFANRPTRPDHTGVPTAVFSQPTVGCVGLTEAGARHEIRDRNNLGEVPRTP